MTCLSLNYHSHVSWFFTTLVTISNTVLLTVYFDLLYFRYFHFCCSVFSQLHVFMSFFVCLGPPDSADPYSLWSLMQRYRMCFWNGSTIQWGVAQVLSTTEQKNPFITISLGILWMRIQCFTSRSPHSQSWSVTVQIHLVQSPHPLQFSLFPHW